MPRAPSGFAENPQDTFTASGADTAARHLVEIGKAGRIVIPAPIRQALGLKEGDRLHLVAEGQELRLYSFAEGLRRLRAEVRKFVPEGVSLADELIEERRAEARLGTQEFRQWLIKRDRDRAARKPGATGR